MFRRMPTFLAAAILLGCAAEPPPPPAGAPRLILFLVIDQGRYDYFERFEPLLRSGLGRLLRESTVFVDAHHDHARTTTAPGHATLATGMIPAHHGIIDNWWTDRGTREQTAAVGEEQTPRLLRSPTIGDWLKAAYPPSKVFAASGKDRAAILLAGKEADAAYWLSSSEGRFVTSDYYGAREPGWLVAYHAAPFPDRIFGRSWEPLPEVVEHGPAYGVGPLDTGVIDRRFPHPLGGPAITPGSSFYSAFRASPYGDEYLGDFAARLIEGEGLGQDGYPDFLGLSFSSMDMSGHTFGPDSPELLDTFLRLDRVIGDLLAAVDRTVGLEHTIVSLSSDHGVTPVPEVLRAKGVAARRLDAGEVACFQQARSGIVDRFGSRRWFFGSFYFDRQVVEEAGIEPAVIESEARRLLEQCPGVARVWTRSELEHGGAGDPMRRLYANSFDPERSSDVIVQLEPHTLPGWRVATSHGSAYPYDTHVPWMLRLPSAAGGRVEQRVHTVDVAPTLAELIGLTPPADLDGVSRRALLSTPGS